MSLPVTTKVARAVHANAGEVARYRRRMLALIDEMHTSVLYWLQATYRDAPPALAQDATPSVTMQRALSKVAKRWLKRFDDGAPKIAEAYLKGQFKATDSAMRQALKDAGWTVKFEMTPAMKDALDATIGENIGLIKSIPEQYLSEVQGAVMRSYARGRDLSTMVKDIRRIYPKAARRADFISLDQSNKANAVVTAARQISLGIEEGVWMHSHAGKTPRPTHVAMNGKRYKIREGMWDSAVQRFVFPGQEPGCRCTGRSVLPF